MTLFDLLQDYARQSRIAPDPEMNHPELGMGLSLFHDCLIEIGLDHSGEDQDRQLTASPLDIQPNHLSQFVVGFLPFNSISTREETNSVLFEVYSFIHWLEKRDIAHGLEDIHYQNVVKKLTQDQDRCLQLSHFLDEETLRILEDPPHIVDTISDIFQVFKIDSDFIYLKGKAHQGPIRLRLPDQVLGLMKLNDNLDLVLGDTSEKWIVLEAGQVFPEWDSTSQQPSIS